MGMITIHFKNFSGGHIITALPLPAPGENQGRRYIPFARLQKPCHTKPDEQLHTESPLGRFHLQTQAIHEKYFATAEDYDQECMCPNVQWVNWSIELNPGQTEQYAQSPRF